MNAAVYDEFQGPITVRTVPDPAPSNSGVILRVKACGICRSDWHGWRGSDRTIRLPHVPGHELAGEIVAKGSAVRNFGIGDRVTLPFVCGCGSCGPCLSGDQHICDDQFQPGFTAWGGFAELVAIEFADNNLVRLPPDVGFIAAAPLGCRFATAFRAVVDQGRVKPGQWVAVYGCGGAGLSAIMIAAAFGARVVAVDVADVKLEFARSAGAEFAVNSTKARPDESILEITGGGAHISIDALGDPKVLFDSVSSLRKRGKHIQVGIMGSGERPPVIPIGKIIGRELEIIGSHGMQAHRYAEMFEMIRSGKLKPDRLIGKTVSLEMAGSCLANLDAFDGAGVIVIEN